MTPCIGYSRCSGYDVVFPVRSSSSCCHLSCLLHAGRQQSRHVALATLLHNPQPRHLSCYCVLGASFSLSLCLSLSISLAYTWALLGCAWSAIVSRQVCLFEINRQFVTEFSSYSSWQMKLCNDERENGASETATSGITGKSIKHFLLPRVAMQAPLHYTIYDDGNIDVYESVGHY